MNRKISSRSQKSDQHGARSGRVTRALRRMESSDEGRDVTGGRVMGGSGSCNLASVRAKNGVGLVKTKMGFAKTLFDSVETKLVFNKSLLGFVKTLFDLVRTLLGFAKTLFDFAETLLGFAETLFDFAKTKLVFAETLYGFHKTLFEFHKSKSVLGGFKGLATRGSPELGRFQGCFLRGFLGFLRVNQSCYH